MEKKKRIVILGGGLTGLSAAYYLQKDLEERNQEADITLIEASPRLGGKIQTVRKNGCIIERGPDSFLERKKSAPQLVRDLGMEDQLVNNSTGRSYVLLKDGLHPIPSGAVMGIPTQLLPFVTSGLFSLPGKLRAAGDFVLPRGGEKRDQSLGKFFRRRLGDEVVENLIEPLLSGIYAGDIDKLSLMSTFPQFYKTEQEHRSLILGMKKSVPSSNQKHDPSKKKGIFQTLAGGLESLIEGLEKNLTGVRVLKGTKVVSLQKTAGETYTIELNGGTVMEADAVIMTIPHTAAGALLKDSEFDYFRSMPSTSVANVAMIFPKEKVRMSKEGTGFVISRNGGFSITACTWTNKKWPHTAPEDKVILRAYVGKAGEETIVDQSDEQLVSIAIEDLKKAMDISGMPEDYVVSRWKQAMPQYNVGHKENVEKIVHHVKESYPGLFLAGASFEGVGLPDCIDQGKAAVTQVKEYLQL
ncbi:protoporphyrinogen oxidase [Bacillus sp. FJAT-42376]|uniref:protoporphyrinogen oxidase n=1 Tax=Bacillus sp. FJAT-42376 TaxID=2014076 RepID=UPI000F4FFA29|nr:protoporphyrinogen oxidase [Bacillus sp. FJAT-42376]AZB42252.1 protoporphyrinogen oxidase [Bacillus sp. FJAT-42376]